jgi:hypothetical protein
VEGLFVGTLGKKQRRKLQIKREFLVRITAVGLDTVGEEDG